MESSLFVIVGLIFDIAGVILLMIGSLSLRDLRMRHRDQKTLKIDMSQDAFQTEVMNELEKMDFNISNALLQARKAQIRLFWGLGLLLIGFTFQIVGSMMTLGII